MRKLLLALALSWSLFGQTTGQNVVNVLVASASATTNFSGTSSALQNIGQTSHIVTLTFGTVTGGGFYRIDQLVVQGSPDCVTYTNIGSTFDFATLAIANTSNVTYTAYGYGSYPCIRVAWSAQVTTLSLTYKIGYQGTSTPAFTNIDQVGFFNPTASFVALAGADNAFHVIASGIVGLTPSIYALSVYSDVTAKLITIGCSSNGTSINKTFAKALTTAAFPFQMEWTASLRPYAVCVSGDSIGYIVSAGTTTYLHLSYRLE